MANLNPLLEIIGQQGYDEITSLLKTVGELKSKFHQSLNPKQLSVSDSVGALFREKNQLLDQILVAEEAYNSKLDQLRSKFMTEREGYLSKMTELTMSTLSSLDFTKLQPELDSLQAKVNLTFEREKTFITEAAKLKSQYVPKGDASTF